MQTEERAMQIDGAMWSVCVIPDNNIILGEPILIISIVCIFLTIKMFQLSMAWIIADVKKITAKTKIGEI